MPDQSCRICGGELISYLFCPECKKSTQRICGFCDRPTLIEYHQDCIEIQAKIPELKTKMLQYLTSQSQIIDQDNGKLNRRYEIYH